MFRQKERILPMVILAAGGQASECVVSPIRSIITIGSEP